MTALSDRPSTEADASPRAVVEAFVAALERLDIEAAMALTDPEVSYRNVPMPASHGQASTERQLRALLGLATGFEARMLNLAVEDDTVLTERIDVIAIGRFRMQFWVCGSFRVRDGRVLVWRDRFDVLDVTVSILRGLAGLVVPALNRDRLG